MSDILLLEPNYRNKYPPLGLMKLSYYHKEIKKDYVRFAKGTLPEIYKNKKWDRIYVTTLFTFEWEETIRTIEYAKQIVKSIDNIWVGGIAASLMPNELYNETGIKPIAGLLNEKGKIGYEDDDTIDTITPDYSMLEDIRSQYIYPYENAYFMYTTRGCGMNCGFCAVKILEPKFINRISIQTQIEEINKKYGEKKDLLLMDNNVLNSPLFDEIVNEIKKVGFGKGATYINRLTGKRISRYVDFNQGLDAFLMTEEKTKKLSELAINPARIAFDHIEDLETYKTVVRRCAQYGITELSNYILYNCESFSGKGHAYKADTPEELYERLMLTLELKEEINNSLPENRKISIFSFPMRYIPLKDKKRGYVSTNWNTKKLRAIQVMMMPTQGKGVSGRGFFEADFGKNIEEYKKVLLMPEDIIMSRGHFDDNKLGKKKETEHERESRRKQWEEKRQILNEWERLYEQLNDLMPVFIDLISDNVYSYEKWLSIDSFLIKKIFIHYLNYSKLLLFVDKANEKKDLELVFEYCTKEFPLLFSKVSGYIYQSKLSSIYLEAFIKVFGKVGFQELIQLLFNDNCNNDFFLNNLEKVKKPQEWDNLDVDILRILKNYLQLNSLNEDEKEMCKRMMLDAKYEGIVEILKSNFQKFKKSLKHTVIGSPGEKELNRQIDIITKEIYKQLTLF